MRLRSLSHYFLRFLLFAALVLTILPQWGHGHTMPNGKPVHHRIRHHKLRRKDSTSIAKSKKLSPSPPEVKLHMPTPGHDGEEVNDWFYRRRAWPNEAIDPEAYPNALAEAAKMPVLSHPATGKHGTLETFSWQNIGPYSIDGRVSCIATHPIDSNTFYIGAAAGGLWKTTNHGTSWRCVTDTFGMLASGCVAIDPVQPETIYLGQGEPNQSGDSYPGNGLWKSTDGGDSWTYLGFAKSQYIGKIIIDPNNHNTIFIAVPGPSALSDSNRGVFRSFDGGLTWSRSLFVRLGKAKTSNSVGFIDVAMNPTNSGELVAFAWDHLTSLGSGFSTGSTGPNSGVWRTVDTGKTWSRIDTVAGSGLPNGVKTKVLGRGAVLWTVGGHGKLPQTYVFAAYTRADTNIVTHYMTDDNFEGLYRSGDEGLTWTKVIDSTLRIPMGGVQGKDSANITNAQGGYDLYLAANPARPGEVYLGGIDVFRSTDFGLSFKDITNSYSQYYVKDNRQQHSDQHGLAFTAAPSGTDMIVVSDGGVFHTNDFGSTWNQTTGLPITMFYAIEPWKGGMQNTASLINASDLKVFGGTQDNGTVAHGLTPDTNFAWINAGDGGVAASNPDDSTEVVTSLQLGVIFARNSLDSLVPAPLAMRDTTHDARPRWHTLSYRLLRGQQSQTDTTESCAFIAPVVLDNQHPTDLYTGRCHVYRAVLDWNDLENTKWYRWSPQLAGNPANDSQWYYGDLETIAIGPRDVAGHPMLWAGGYIYATPSSALWRTVLDPTRRDTTQPKWIPINSGLPGTTISCIVPDRTDSLTAFITTMGSSSSDGQHVLRTTDGGAHWTNISGNLPHAPISAMVIDSLAERGNPALKNQILIVGTDVGVYVTVNGGTSWSAFGSGMPHIIVNDLKIYKNMLIAATHGRSLYAMDIRNLDPATFDVQAGSGGSLLPTINVFPNPVISQSVFHMQVEVPLNSSVRWCRLVQESNGHQFNLPFEEESQGRYTITRSPGIGPGAYFIQLLGDYGVLAEGRVSIVQ